MTRSDVGGIDFGRVTVLTFDCYGTLIDWEAGIIGTLRRSIPDSAASDEALLEAYGAQEAAAEAGRWIPYREVLTRAMTAVCSDLGVDVTDAQAAEFGESVADWPPFPDSATALRRVAARFDLAAITNCDDALFAHSNRMLGEPFRWVVTAEQARSYKPSRHNFDVALERIGVPAERIVHVAQSLYHDHVPAKALGLRTVWINRRADRSGSGATPPAHAEPDLVAADMATFAEIALG